MRLLGSAIIVLASPAFAADEIWDTTETRDVQARYGECVVNRNYATARQFVLEPNPDDKGWRRAISKVADSDCLVKAANAPGGVEMKFPVDTMRYALADALVRREFSSAPVASIKQAAPLVQPKLDESDYQPKPGKKVKPSQLKNLKELREKRIGLIFLAGFGECLVRQNPDRAHFLLMAKPASREEVAAFKALNREFADCLPSGNTLSFGRATLRGTIAMNYYRLAHAPRQPATPAGVPK